MKTLTNKLTVPEAGEDILESLETAAMNSTAVIPVASVDEATLVANQMMATGRAITSTRPVIFVVNRVNIYIYDGDIMRPAVQNLYYKATKKGSGAWKTLKPSAGDVTILSCPCAAKPYRRMVSVNAVLNINIGKGDESVSGYVKSFIEIDGVNCGATRLDESSLEGSNMMGRRVVEAGETPDIKLQFRAYGANMKYYISTALGAFIYAETRPVTMDIEESIIIDDPDS